MDRRILVSLFVTALVGVVALIATFNEESKQEVPLPDIAGEFYTTVITDESPESQKLLSYFDSNPQLNKIQQRERHNHLSHTDPYYTENFKPQLAEGNNFPLFIIQRPSGDSCLILSKDTMPNSSEELLGHIRRRCNPEPDKPAVAKVVESVKEKPLVVDTIRKVVTGGEGGDGSLIAFIISALLSGGYGLKQVLEKFNTSTL